MDSLEIVRMKLLVLGINSKRSHPINWQMSIGFFVLGSSTLSNVAFFFLAENIVLMDYVKVFCVITVLIQLLITLIAISLQQMKFIELIEVIEKIIKGSN